jgi:hypothetical protein
MTFLEGHLLAEAYWQQQTRQVRPMAMLLQAYWNVHRDTDQRRDPFTLEDMLAVLGYPEPPPPPPPPPRLEDIEARIGILHQMYTANGERKTD